MAPPLILEKAECSATHKQKRIGSCSGRLFARQMIENVSAWQSTQQA